MKRIYGSKDKLLDAAVKALADLGEDAAALKERLRLASNQRLMHLVAVGAEVKKAFGTKDKLVAAVVKAANKAKDKDFVARLEAMPLPKLLDLGRAAKRGAKASA
ncbi:MAG TPA: hypothetical protein VL172_21345 [Kofleriaceae bacterium]|jgi:hypothetical protein|nr:hypothetical protein [Kofleriaceae bacterium]